MDTQDTPSNPTSNERGEPPMPTAPLSDTQTWSGYYYQLAKYRHEEIERLGADLALLERCGCRIIERLGRRIVQVSWNEAVDDIARLRVALEEIRKPRYGLEMNADDEERANYWSGVAQDYRQIAGKALSGDSSAPVDPCRHDWVYMIGGIRCVICGVQIAARESAPETSLLPGELEQLRRIDKAARAFVDCKPGKDAAKAYAALSDALFDGRPSAQETGPKRLMTHGDNPISGGLMECKSEKAGPKPDAGKAPVSSGDGCPTGEWRHLGRNGKCIYCGAPMLSEKTSVPKAPRAPWIEEELAQQERAFSGGFDDSGTQNGKGDAT